MLDRAVAAVGGARRVDLFGVGASAFVATDLQQKLVRIGRTALSWPDPHGAWTSAATLDSACVAVGVSHGGATADTAEFLRIARGAGAATIGITNFPASNVGEQSDIVLTTAARETSFRSGALGSRIAQLMVVDCLFIGVATATYDESMMALRRRTPPSTRRAPGTGLPLIEQSGKAQAVVGEQLAGDGDRVDERVEGERLDGEALTTFQRGADGQPLDRLDLLHETQAIAGERAHLERRGAIGVDTARHLDDGVGGKAGRAAPLRTLRINSAGSRRAIAAISATATRS